MHQQPNADAFSASVLSWFATHGRKDLPWQRDPTPYRVWVSEIMLQQTQVAVVIPYFERFTTTLPSVRALAEVAQDPLMALWSGLGYYARARHLREAAIQICERHAGMLPASIDDLIALPGIGRSTAGAILSLAMNQRHPILDGNVKRVLTRYFGIEGWPGQRAVERQLWTLAEQLTPQTGVAEYTQAMMDLGATLCTRAKPACARCPVASACIARIQQRQAALPAPKPRRSLPERDTCMLVVINPQGEVLLERRPQSGLWGGLWTLPEITAPHDPTHWCQAQLGIRPVRLEIGTPRRHPFSHFSLNIGVTFVHLGTGPQRVGDDESQGWFMPHEIDHLGLPAPVRAILQALLADDQVQRQTRQPSPGIDP